MSDRRIEILREEYEKVFSTQKYDGSVNKNMNESYVLPAMDQHFTERAMELLEYMAKKKIICMKVDGVAYFLTQGESLTKEQLFKNFL